MRSEDRLVVNELHPEDQNELKRLFAHDPAVKVMGLDAWTALKALLPPPERRGVMLIDPAFEEAGELDRLADGLKRSGTPIRLWNVPALVSDQGDKAGCRVPPQDRRAGSAESDGDRDDDPRLGRRNAPQRCRARCCECAFYSDIKLERPASRAGTCFGSRKGRWIPPRGAGNRDVERQLRDGREALASSIFFSDTSIARADDRPGGDFE